MKMLAWVLVAGAVTAGAQAPVDAVLRPYTACRFDDGLVVTEKSALPADVAGRTVMTIAGNRQVPLERGEKIAFAYPGGTRFANVTVEQLPTESFEQGKANLIANFDHILAGGDDGARNMPYALHPMLNGFEVHGLDRLKIDGATLGIYLLIDDKTRIVTTAYFLNQGPEKRKFATIEEYGALRDHFLNAYTKCVHAPPVVKKAVAKAPVKRKRR
jgi:hypothetical protein